MKNNWKTILSTLLVGMMIVGCGSAETAETVTVVASDNGWDSQKLHNEIAGLVIENAFEGYEFEVSTASSTMNWQALLDGDVSVDIESWTDSVVSYQDDIARGDIVEVGTVVPDNKQGFFVPRYVIEGDAERGIEAMAPDLKTVADLANYPELFPDEEDESMGMIYGALPGWMIDEVMHKKYLYYGLDEMYVYRRLGSEGTLFASMVSAYNKGEGWVGYCYQPTWVLGQLDMVMLGDQPYTPELYAEGGSEIPSQELKNVMNKEFSEANPEITEFFSKYRTGADKVNEALAYLSENDATHEETAIWMLTEAYPELLDEWLTPEQTEKVRAAIA